MEFFAVNGKRPTRLSEETRFFAYESQNRKYGLDTSKTPGVCMDDYEGFEELTLLEKYDAVIERIAKTAPLRICENEKITGAATLGIAIDHNIPGLWKGEPIFRSSVSHLTLDFETVLKKGVDYIQEKAEKGLEKHRGTDREPFLRSCLRSLDSMRIWHNRYMDALKDLPQYEANYQNLKNVPFKPAANFYEAVQSIWSVFSFNRLCGNWPGIGRIDWLLGDYLEKDLESGVLTLEQAREILAHLFIKGCEWIRGGEYVTGDAQHYQNILLAGIDENGNEVANKVTYLVLDVIEELGISDFPTSVRVNKNTDSKLLQRVAEVIRYGGGVVAIYDEEVVIDSLVEYGYSLKEARQFANDGCWEVQIPGKTYFTYIPFDALQVLQSRTLDAYSGKVTFSDFDSLYHKFIEDLEEEMREVYTRISRDTFRNRDIPREEWRWNSSIPCTVISLFENGCIEKGLSYYEGGPEYNVMSPHIGGLPDVANSLYAIKKLVFDEQKVGLSELMQILKNNWQDCEALRQYSLNKYAYFGNDNDEVDTIVARIVEDFAVCCENINEVTAYQTPGGISTFGRQIEWAPYRFATPYGKKAHDVLAANFSPTPGTDKESATAIIKSYCKSNLKRMVTGAALDVKLLPSAVNGENGIEAIVSLIRGFVELGGHFMQLDIADMQLLKEAQEHPENYQNLSVRVSGWNARFVTLNKQWQDMIIAQTGSEI